MGNNVYTTRQSYIKSDVIRMVDIRHITDTDRQKHTVKSNLHINNLF
jgi:hypothetical protein